MSLDARRTLPMAQRVCRVCLAGDLESHRIQSPVLHTFYETLTHVKLNNGGPESLCCYCVAMLQKCCKFVETARRANTMLEQCYHRQTDWIVKPLHTYSKTAVNTHTYLHNNNGNNELDIKIEPGNICLVSLSMEETVDYLNGESVDDGENNIRTYSEEIDRKHHDMYIETTRFDQVEPYIGLKLEFECNNDQKDLNHDQIDPINDQIDPNNDEIDPNDDQIDPNNDEIYLNKGEMDPYNGEMDFINGKMDLSNGETDINNDEMDITNDKTNLTNDETVLTNGKIERINEVDDDNNQTEGFYSQTNINTNDQTIDNIQETFSFNKSKNINAVNGKTKSDSQKRIYKTINENLMKEIKRRNTFNKEKKFQVERYKLTNKKEKKLSCDMCDYKSVSMQYLNQHKTRVHSMRKTVPCPICKEKLNNITYLSEHVKEKHKESNIKVNILSCDVCDFKCLKKSQFRNHILRHNGGKVKRDNCDYFGSGKVIRGKRHIGEKRFPCDLCDLVADTKLSLIQHGINYHGSIDKLHYCLMCDFKFIAKYQLKNHLWKHGEENTCTECNKEFSDVYQLNEHLKLHKETISCDNCDYKCSNRIKLTNHIKNHSKKFKCDFCELKFSKKNYLKAHIRSHKGVKSHVCDLCDYKTDFPNNLRRHILTHTKRKPHACPECKTKHKSENHLKNHMKTVHNKYYSYNRQSCKKCDFKCEKISQLERHNKLKHPIRPFRKKPGEKCICDYCGLAAKKKSELERHIFKHTGFKPYICPECKQAFKCKYYLKKHINIKHVYDKKTCPNCNKHVQNETELQLHLNVCLKKFLCDICGSKWKNSLLLKRHMMIHTGEKPFACEICPYRCSLESSMVKHIRVHTNEKPYACDKCSYRCAVSSNLLRHLASHSDEKPFSCHICDAKYKIKRDLKRHVARLHGCSDTA